MTERGRWLYHVVLRDEWERERDRAADAYWPSAAGREGFIHASYRDAVLESARLYFAPGSARVIVRIDPRRVGAPIAVADTPRGPMPHIHGPVPRAAVAEVYEEDLLARVIGAAPDEI